MENTSGVEPRPAATLVIVRDGPEGPEVLLTIRPEHLRFMGGAAVFPGGAIADADADPRWEKASALSSATAAEALGEDGDALAPYVCALRESFEEVGLLLAEGPSDGLTRSDTDSPERFLERCLELGVVLRTDLLVPAGRWATPLGAPIRFDARFFIARAPERWEPVPDPAEVADLYWIGPDAALERNKNGKLLMAPPTLETLRRIREHDDVSHLLESLSADAEDERVERLSPLVQRVVAPNPSLMTGPGTNTYIVGSGPSCVIDPAVDDPEFIDAVISATVELESILITHRHPDHIGGIAALLEHKQVPVRAFGKDLAGAVQVEPIEDGEVIEVGSARLTAMHTPGHARDHLCFFMEGAASLFSGDNVLGHGTAVIGPPEGNMRVYLDSLARLRQLFISRIYPGHFDPLDGGNQILDYYISHRAERNESILSAIGQGASSVEEIVARVYVDTPVELHPVAAEQVKAHLEMLKEEKRVDLAGNRWILAGVD